MTLSDSKKWVVAARRSPLSQVQVREAMSLLGCSGYEMKARDSFGDLHLDLSLRDSLPGDFFTREMDVMVVAGEADFAVHSAKDLPYQLAEELRIVALLPCLDPTDCLVSRDNVSLNDLPSGAVIATSSHIRQTQLSQLRSDLNFVDVRGTIEERIAFVDQGGADGLVVATCAMKRLSLEKRIAQLLPIPTFPLQGHLAIVARRDRHDVAELWAALDIRRTYGKVYLVGFGPGDPELLTLKAHRVLLSADVILYDDLIEQSALASYDAEKVYVGKRKGFKCKTQFEINDLILDYARKGCVVVRLKGGDPGIFGRAGEEAEQLQLHRIPYEIIPGITSAMAAAASQNIALTYRGVSNTFSFLTAHHADTRDIRVPDVDTIVYYMGASQLAALRNTLLSKGRSALESVLLVQNATLPEERSEIRTIGTMAESLLESPLMVIVGAVAEKAAAPIRVLYTGLNPGRYRSLHKVIHYPLIETHPCEYEPVDLALFESIIFTSAEAVRYFLKTAFLPATLPIVAIGDATARALEDRGYAVAHQPSVAESPFLAKLIGELPYSSYLYPCSHLSRNVLHDLEQVTPLVVYRTLPRDQKALDLSAYDEVVFTSPSTADAFLKIYSVIPKHLIVRTLGSVTKNYLKPYLFKE